MDEPKKPPDENLKYNGRGFVSVFFVNFGHVSVYFGTLSCS